MKIRKATKEDCPGMLQLIRELAEYEKAPQEVTVDPKHFEESGFGENPVWWAFVVDEVEGVEGDDKVEGVEGDDKVEEVEGVEGDDKVEGVEEVEAELNDDLPTKRNEKTTNITPLLPRQMGQRHSSSGIGGVDHASEASMRRGGSNPLVAFALYYIRYSTWKGQIMYLEDIIVTESMRGKGIGKMLIEKLIEEAREKGFKRITWQVLDWNEPAINFYKKFNAKFDPEWVNVTIEC
jgi:GNAT superfamily N-acetyltransferase